MSNEAYTPGHTQNATSFMAERTLASHGQFFADCLESSHTVLDVGCGPGTITLGIAAKVTQVQAIDSGGSQIEASRRNADQAGITNVEFTQASCYELPFEDGSFDRVFSHALMEHLARPVDALKEFLRVTKPGGIVGVCSPDRDGWLLAPPSAKLEAAADAYAELQASNGGDLRIGKKLGGYLCDAGFTDVRINARYECYPSLDFIGEYLALQFDEAGQPEHAQCLRGWSRSDAGLFAQSWVSAIGTRPD